MDIPKSHIPETSKKQTKPDSLIVPFAIIVGFALIAASILFSGNNKKESFVVINSTSQEKSVPIPPINEDDHIRGNPNAPIVIIEYSNFICSSCKKFNTTMNQIMNTYGTNGQVAWVYRNSSDKSLDSEAYYVAKASECVAKIGGNESFWKFSDLIFQTSITRGSYDTSIITELADASGVDKQSFSTCLEQGDVEIIADASFSENTSVGAEKAPYTVIFIGQEQLVIDKTQPYEYISQVIDVSLEKLGGY